MPVADDEIESFWNKTRLSRGRVPNRTNSDPSVHEWFSEEEASVSSISGDGQIHQPSMGTRVEVRGLTPEGIDLSRMMISPRPEITPEEAEQIERHSILSRLQPSLEQVLTAAEAGPGIEDLIEAHATMPISDPHWNSLIPGMTREQAEFVIHFYQDWSMLTDEQQRWFVERASVASNQDAAILERLVQPVDERGRMAMRPYETPAEFEARTRLVRESSRMESGAARLGPQVLNNIVESLAALNIQSTVEFNMSPGANTLTIAIERPPSDRDSLVATTFDTGSGIAISITTLNRP